MQITELPPEHAACLVPLNLTVQALHSADDPARYVHAPDPQDVARFLQDWLSQPHVTALIAGPMTAPHGYLIYDITSHAPSVLRCGETRAMLHHICVDAAHRRRGLARALITAMRARADVRAADSLWTSYASFNTASAALMASVGFAPQTVIARA